MNIEDVLARFALLAGLRSDEASVWMPVCRGAIAEINSRLKQPDPAQKEEEALCHAAAALAYYRYSMTASCWDQSFSAGDISVTRRADEVQRAERMWNDAQRAISSLVKDQDFVFERVWP